MIAYKNEKELHTFYTPIIISLGNALAIFILYAITSSPVSPRVINVHLFINFMILSSISLVLLLGPSMLFFYSNAYIHLSTYKKRIILILFYDLTIITMGMNAFFYAIYMPSELLLYSIIFWLIVMFVFILNMTRKL